MPAGARSRAIPVRTAIGAVLLAAPLALVAGCGGGGSGSDTGITAPAAASDPNTSDPTTSGASAGAGGSPYRHGSPSPSAPVGSETGAADVDGAPMAQTQAVGTLDVSVLGYRRAGYSGAARGTRVDVVTVEECAARGPAQLRHRSWQLLGAGGRRLGSAGGKMVDGFPTEDLPRELADGECLKTALAIGVPVDAQAVAIRDGTAASWLISR